MKNKTCFYKRKIETTRTTTEIGVQQFCCKQLKKACTQYETGKGKFANPNYSATHYSNFMSTSHKGKIGMYTHYTYDYDRDEENYVEFKYCPFCGTEIGGFCE